MLEIIISELDPANTVKLVAYLKRYKSIFSVGEFLSIVVDKDNSDIQEVGVQTSTD